MVFEILMDSYQFSRLISLQVALYAASCRMADSTDFVCTSIEPDLKDVKAKTILMNKNFPPTKKIHTVCIYVFLY